MFLFIIQFILTVLLVLMLISGEIHKPAAVLVCFPLLMSRMGRGAIILMIGLPLTNFLEFWTVVIAIVVACVGILNMSLGWRDGVVELKFANDGVPDWRAGGIPSAQTTMATPAGAPSATGKAMPPPMHH